MIMTKIDFVKALQTAQLERDVEQVYNNGISLFFPNVDIEHPFACDGLITTKENDKLLKLIIEYKFDENFISKFARAKVITQVIYYIKQIENAGMILPNVVLVGDKNECFCFHTNCIIKYLDYNCDWSIAPSRAGLVNLDMVNAIAGDDEVNPFVFDIKEGFDFENVVEKIKELACNVQRYVHITDHNIATIYDTFLNRVVRNQKKMSSHDLVGVFMGVITNGEEYYKHPAKKNLLVTPNKNVEIDSSAFDAFFSYFQRTYTPQEKNNFAAIADRLIEDTDRRNSGDYFTPTAYCDFAHKMISEQLGENWKDEYVVYDSASGTHNLTRDYRFGELYCSTLFDSELEIGKRYNQEATKFQFDFLNDYFPMKGDLHKADSKVPAGLLKALEKDKPIVFFLNPPYGKSTGAGGKISSGVSDSEVKKQMQKVKIEGSELLKQFLYRITKIKQSYNLTNCYVACFTSPSWLIKPQGKQFRKLFLNEFEYINGTMFCASEFADCADNWGITFNIWKNGKQADKNNFLHTLTRRNESGEVEIFDTKVLYNFDDTDAITTTEYINGANKSKAKRNREIVVCKDIKAMSYEKITANVYDDYICCVRNNANDVQQNQVCFINDATPNMPGYLQLTESNILESCVSLAIRRLISDEWTIHNDMYDMNHEIPNSFKLDCLVWSIFASYCCSINIEGGRLNNEFFFMSKSDMEVLGNENGNDVCYIGARTSNERFVYSYLQAHRNELSAAALKVLEKAEELVRISFKYRAMFDEENPEYQINNWDCGWYQIKGLLKMYCHDELKGFQELYKALSDKMRPMVYELGFLKK